MTAPSIENFATSPNLLFVAEVYNTVGCGQIKPDRKHIEESFILLVVPFA